MVDDIVIIGAGYVGLPNAVFFADAGYSVVAIDKNEKIIRDINIGISHVKETDVEILLKKHVMSGNLKASNRLVEGKCYIIAVPTPICGTDKTADVSYVFAAIEELCPLLKKDDLILLFSTCPVGTTEKIATIIQECRTDLIVADENCKTILDISIAYCPERVMPGSSMQELRDNLKVVGGYTNLCTKKVKIFLFKAYGNRMLVAENSRAAELIKLTENSYRDVQIAYVNQLSMICDEVKVDVSSIIKIANEHPRIDLLTPGIGVGGHCIPVDPWFLIKDYPSYCELSISARKINLQKENFILQKIISAFTVSKKKKIMIFGLSYKENIGDFRESPAVRIFEALHKHYPDVYAIDTHINSLEQIHENVSSEIISNDALASFFNVLLVKHTDFVENLQLHYDLKF